MPGAPRIDRRLVGLLAVAAVTVAACSSSDTTSSTTEASTTSVVDDSSTTVAETTTTAVPTTLPPADTTTTVDASTTTTTTLPPTTTTTEPLAVQELLLSPDGIGLASFGAESEAVIDYMTSILGGNTGDTGWVDPFTFADCSAGGAATVARRVNWGVLSLLFSDASIYAIGRRHLMGYEYGRDGQLGDEPQGLRTAGGVTLGSRIVDLLAEFPEARINPGEPDLNIPDNFYVSDEFRGLLLGTGPEDVITVFFGGYGCFE